MLFSIPGVENLSQTTVTIVALVLALVLVAFFGLILRRLTSGRLSLKNDRGRARQPRLGIVDVYDLDRQRQLILLRRDNVEHLLLVGGPNDVVVETNIVRAGGSRLPATPVEAQDRADPAAERSVEIAPVRPVLEPIGTRSPEPVAARLGTADTMARGAIEPALKPSSVSAAPTRRPTDSSNQPDGGAQVVGGAQAIGGAQVIGASPVIGSATPDGGAARFGDPGAATPRGTGQPIQRTAPPTGRPDMAKQLEEALARPAPEPRPATARTLELPRATPVAQPGRMMSVFRKTEAASTPATNGRSEPAPVSAPAAETTPPPAPALPQTPAGIDPGPAEAQAGREPVLPDPAGGEPVGGEPRRQDVAQQGPERQEAERTEPPSDEVLDDDVQQEDVRADVRREESSAGTESETEAPPASPPAPTETQVRSSPRPVQAAPQAAPILVSPPPPPPAASPARNDPFSIEDIEAEFARLLGRPVEKRDDRT